MVDLISLDMSIDLQKLSVRMIVQIAIATSVQQIAIAFSKLWSRFNIFRQLALNAQTRLAQYTNASGHACTRVTSSQDCRLQEESHAPEAACSRRY